MDSTTDIQKGTRSNWKPDLLVFIRYVSHHGLLSLFLLESQCSSRRHEVLRKLPRCVEVICVSGYLENRGLFMLFFSSTLSLFFFVMDRGGLDELAAVETLFCCNKSVMAAWPSGSRDALLPK